MPKYLLVTSLGIEGLHTKLPLSKLGLPYMNALNIGGSCQLCPASVVRNPTKFIRNWFASRAV